MVELSLKSPGGYEFAPLDLYCSSLTTLHRDFWKLFKSFVHKTGLTDFPVWMNHTVFQIFVPFLPKFLKHTIEGVCFL